MSKLYGSYKIIISLKSFILTLTRQDSTHHHARPSLALSPHSLLTTCDGVERLAAECTRLPLALAAMCAPVASRVARREWEWGREATSSGMMAAVAAVAAVAAYSRILSKIAEHVSPERSVLSAIWPTNPARPHPRSSYVRRLSRTGTAHITL